jgi:hypothetical protein
MREPIDDEDDVSGPVNVIPPTPEPPLSGKAEEDGIVPDQPAVSEDQYVNEDDVLSPTAAILDQMESYAPTEDTPVVTGTAGLKRAQSGEVSRLRGPRGARGPRPLPGRVPSHSGSASIVSMGSIIGEAENIEPETGRVNPPGMSLLGRTY